MTAGNIVNLQPDPEIVKLLQQVKNGNVNAFAKIYDRFSKQFYRNILYLVKDEDVAQELLQELFLKFWLKREYIDASKKWQSYLYETARNLVLTHFRKVAKDQRVLNHLILTTVDHVTSIENSIINRETHAILHEAIESLPQQSKQAFKLCKFEGKSYQEAADLLGISPLTIRNQIVHANKAIKKYVLEHPDIAILLITTCILSGLNQ